MEIDLETKQQLTGLLAKPATVTQAHAGMLATLVKTYPYYQPLHLLLAKANINALQNDHLATAALYNNGGLLHQVVYNPENLVVSQLNVISAAAIKAEKNTEKEQLETTPDVEFIEPVPFENRLSDEQETFDEIAEVNPIHTEVSKADEQEVFNEIVEIDPTAFIPTTLSDEAEQEEKQSFEEENLPDELAIESIVATDFFAFEKSFHTEQAAEGHKTAPIITTQPEEYNQEAEAQTVSKYNDDKLPYTFLWWLAKTRKEHEQIFQPYVTPKKNTNPNPSELQQQYVEHIFHLQTPFNVADEANRGPLNRQIASKGGDIIDSFIKNEPQIRPPKPEQINNENKAKKSAEDHYDLVSETLAAIYIEQMLYHKAIDTYEKLSLKFPEKSRYFADLIQSLEKKI